MKEINRKKYVLSICLANTHNHLLRPYFSVRVKHRSGHGFSRREVRDLVQIINKGSEYWEANFLIFDYLNMNECDYVIGMFGVNGLDIRFIKLYRKALKAYRKSGKKLRNALKSIVRMNAADDELEAVRILKARDASSLLIFIKEYFPSIKIPEDSYHYDLLYKYISCRL